MRSSSVLGVTLSVIFLSLISFVWPLWSIHTAMKKEKVEIENNELSLVTQQIDLISRDLAVNTEKIAHLNEKEIDNLLEENEMLEKKIHLLPNTYIERTKLPVWPFDKNIVLKLAGSQGIPLLGVTGVGANVLAILNNPLEWLKDLS